MSRKTLALLLIAAGLTGLLSLGCCGAAGGVALWWVRGGGAVPDLIVETSDGPCWLCHVGETSDRTPEEALFLSDKDLTPVREAGLFRSYDLDDPDLPPSYVEKAKKAGITGPFDLLIDGADGDVFVIQSTQADAGPLAAKWRSLGGAGR